MRYGSVCSGIEAATVAWEPLGWQPAFFSEIDAFPRAVLAHHYPDVPLHGDFTTIEGHEYGPIDVLVGGTPCQSFSVAGLRGGLADDRGNLALEFLRLAQRARPRWLVWENVPGVLSSGGGRDFGSILGGLVELGYGFAYRVLDAQFFGVAQRRRRVFVVGYLGDWRRAAAVLFERHSLSGHPAPRREAGKADPTIPSRRSAGGGLGTDFDLDGGITAACITTRVDSLDAESTTLIAATVTSKWAKGSGGPAGSEHQNLTVVNSRQDPITYDDQTGPLDTDGQTYTLAIRGRGDSHDLEYRQDGTANAIPTPNGGRGGIGVGAVALPINTQIATRGGQLGERTGFGIGEPGEPAFTLQAGHSHAVAFAQNTRDEVREMPYVGALAADAGMKQTSYVRTAMAVRRLTPRECERLQGFPDDYTLIPYRNKPAADGPRYKALGNSMAVPVMRWIGERIAMVEQIP